ncbi:hypothetical protein BD410DRAFT_842754 [Rickenella mellea]|uniref:Uncharacterized protein n=1 Tax=Rickenella mellea TaxID=50990 RepID=A0A4Y7PT70_9AGAM|nr:hypothetical protein BD410DRAFT_842754 [Rickenella mellea]
MNIDSMGFNGEILNLLGTVHLFACSKTDDRPLSCLRANYYVAWAQWLYCIPFQLVLFLRVLAVWESDRKVAGILAIVASVYYSSMIAIGVILTKSFRRPEPLEALVTESLQECFTSLPGTFLRLARFAYGLCLLSDGVMFTLILVKAIITERRARARLLSYLLRDGSVYYTVLFALSIGSVSMAVILPAERVILALSFSTAIFVAQSIGASHILLYLRKYSTEEQIQTVSGMQFADRRTIMDELSRQMVFDIPDGSDIDDRTDE